MDDPDGPWRKRYTLVPIQIALYFLAQGSPSVKAKAICELFQEAHFLNPSPMAGINTNTLLSGQDDKLSEYMLTKD